MNHERIDELLALAALGELTAVDARELDAALVADPSLAAELDADLAAAAGVQRVAAEAPPASLKASILDAIAAMPQDLPADGPIGIAHDAPVHRPDAPVVSLDGARRRRVTQTLLAAAAVIALVVGGVLIAGTRGGSPSVFEAVTEAPDAETRSLDGELTGSLRVIYSAEEDAFVLDGANLPALAGDQTYQLWFVDTAGVAMSVGLFRPSDDGRVLQRFDDLDPTGVVVGVTIEPSGGSASPTLPIIASA